MIPMFVITGGPCAGKTSVLEGLKKEITGLIVVPEAATIIRESGGQWPMPGRELKERTPEWQAELQAAIVGLQFPLENVWEMVAEQNGQSFVLCDRGILDGAAYVPGGIVEFCARFQLCALECIKKYFAVIHLESLAASNSSLYQALRQTPPNSNFLTLEKAQRIEENTKDAWISHPNYYFVGGDNLPKKQKEVLRIVRSLTESL